MVSMEQLKTIGRELAMGSQGGVGQSKEFLNLVKSICEARSKAEEERIVFLEIQTLKQRLSEKAVRKKAIMALHRFYQKSPSSISHLVVSFVSMVDMEVFELLEFVVFWVLASLVDMEVRRAEEVKKK
ncbi:hypothetical protein C1H46_017444 [Malus baccata]|uniref:Clathrin/coatomer adaptor adaptin-like N-terminal domain-containing protein n=1 Tax=Malus baccata TaxID=106549 RepID=A0A540ME22_MALBA|nr:hypothetical protein C1H46_017444 [Malus baccata]